MRRLATLSLSLSLCPFDLLSELPLMRGGGSLCKAAGFLSLPSFAAWQQFSKVLEVVRGGIFRVDLTSPAFLLVSWSSLSGLMRSAGEEMRVRECSCGLVVDAVDRSLGKDTKMHACGEAPLMIWLRCSAMAVWTF
mmetsp:Transcript_73867/g.187320  ORF Transcript_73867/g.187320 Transcript_73867/m.187320 type:complete len:136 (+) Transcript_73867:673-1080(+)